MSKSDKLVNIVLVIFILIHIAVWIMGSTRHKLINYISFLNAIAGLMMIGYWIQGEMRIVQHYVEMREIIFLGLEGLFVTLSVYSILTGSPVYWLRVVQYSIFGLHLAALLLFLVFMLTFKINRLI